jgi:hypothetical protein
MKLNEIHVDCGCYSVTGFDWRWAVSGGNCSKVTCRSAYITQLPQNRPPSVPNQIWGLLVSIIKSNLLLIPFIYCANKIGISKFTGFLANLKRGFYWNIIWLASHVSRVGGLLSCIYFFFTRSIWWIFVDGGISIVDFLGSFLRIIVGLQAVLY